VSKSRNAKVMVSATNEMNQGLLSVVWQLLNVLQFETDKSVRVELVRAVSCAVQTMHDVAAELSSIPPRNDAVRERPEWQQRQAGCLQHIPKVQVPRDIAVGCDYTVQRPGRVQKGPAPNLEWARRMNAFQKHERETWTHMHMTERKSREVLWSDFKSGLDDLVLAECATKVRPVPTVSNITDSVSECSSVVDSSVGPVSEGSPTVHEQLHSFNDKSMTEHCDEFVMQVLSNWYANGAVYEREGSRMLNVKQFMNGCITAASALKLGLAPTPSGKGDTWVVPAELFAQLQENFQTNMTTSE